jgi:hypothetical protein
MSFRGSLDLAKVWRSPFRWEMGGILDGLPGLGEVLFVNASRSLQDQQPCWPSAAILERVRHSTWDVDHFSGATLQGLIAYLEGIPALQDDERLVLQVLNVGRDARNQTQKGM